MFALVRTIVSEFLQKARMRASGVMVSDLQNPARVWPVCHAVLLHAGSQPLASTPLHHQGRSGRNNSRQKSIVKCLKKIHKVERCDGKVKMQGKILKI